MRRLLAIALCLLFACPLAAIEPPKGYAKKFYDATLALYGVRGEDAQFVCTATPYEKIAGGYHLITAGHCVATNPPDLTFAVAEKIGGDLQPATLLKFRYDRTIDFAIFELKTTRVYNVVSFGDDHTVHIGDKTINPHFGDGLIEQLSVGTVSSDIIQTDEVCDCGHGFLVHENAGPGASGSIVVSSKTHKVIGILVVQAGSEGFVVEPISRFRAFLAGPGQERVNIMLLWLLRNLRD